MDGKWSTLPHELLHRACVVSMMMGFIMWGQCTVHGDVEITVGWQTRRSWENIFKGQRKLGW